MVTEYTGATGKKLNFAVSPLGNIIICQQTAAEGAKDISGEKRGKNRALSRLFFFR